MHAVSARTGERRMQENTNVATLVDLRKRKPVGRMTIGIDLGDRRSHFCVLNEQAQVIARGFLPTTITASRSLVQKCKIVSRPRRHKAQVALDLSLRCALFDCTGSVPIPTAPYRTG